MSLFKLIIRSLFFYRKRNFLLALGIAISAAILTGAFMVGDSVKYSLQEIVGKRLGNITHTIASGDRYFSAKLAYSIAEEIKLPITPVLNLSGSVSVRGGELKIGNIKVIGTDPEFDNIAGTSDFYSMLNEGEAIISWNLAQTLNVTTGDDILVRMEKASMAPANAPFVSDQDNIFVTRLSISGVANEEELGAFNLENSQTAPYNVFVSRKFLSERMELGDRANLMLINAEEGIANLEEVVAQNWTLDDLGMNLEYIAAAEAYQLSSERVFMDDEVFKALDTSGWSFTPVLTYFVNKISRNGNSTPYSFVSTLPEGTLDSTGIVINDWLSQDLGADVGDTLNIEYFEVGPLRTLTTNSNYFIVRSVIEIDDIPGGEKLMPEIPGLSDAGNCRDWEAGVPIELEEIRDKDEDYWDQFKGTPKAYISAETGISLWQNRFGSYTSFRIEAGEDTFNEISGSILSGIDPLRVGFTFNNVRTEADKSARNGVDFGQLFAGLSFFLLAGAVLLIVLLYRLNIGERKEQVTTLRAAGIPRRKVHFILLGEGMIISLVGVLIGLGLGIVYNLIVFKALNTIWIEIVRTSMLQVHVSAYSLLIGFFGSMFISFISLLVPLRKFTRDLQRGRSVVQFSSREKKYANISLLLSVILTLSSLLIIFLQVIFGNQVNPAAFFSAGGILLLAGLLASFGFLYRLRTVTLANQSISLLSIKNAIRNSTRSITIVLLLAIGSFLVITTGSNKKGLFTNVSEISSGTGGFLYFAESSMAVLHDLNEKEVRYRNGLDGEYDIVHFRKAAGDDASCLNLNRISNPAIIAVSPEKLTGRFTFVTSTEDLDESNPWSTLDKELSGGLIPAIADQTVIKWSLGLKVGDTLVYRDAKGNMLNLLLVGGLAPSIFQGHVIISEEYFLERFPESSGSNIFLIDGPVEDTASISSELEAGMRDYGWNMQFCPQRLAEFNSVTNTYLSVFLVMGALGLLIGTVGLSIVLFRSVVERREEMATLRALGFSIKQLRKMITREYALLLTAGTLIGSLSAILATLPSILNPGNDISLLFIIIIPIILVLNGLIWITWMTRIALQNKVISQTLRNE